jgi:Gnt-I system high-affinity gluconate transporter
VLILLIFLSILALVLLISWVKLDTFISFLLVSIGLGFAVGLSVPQISSAVQKGIAGTLGDLVMIVGFGAMLGKLVADSGAAQRITDALIKVFGEKYMLWGLALAGFVIGIPLFYNAGFMIVLPLIFMIAATTRVPMLMIAIPMCAALSVAHGYLPPHPSPAAIASQLQADIGKTLFYGILVSIPAIAIAGPIFGKTLGRFKPSPDTTLFNLTPKPTSELPGLTISIVTALLPVFLLVSMAPVKNLFPGNPVLELLAEPWFGMLISVLFAAWVLGIRRGASMKQITKSFEEAFKGVAAILLIVAGAGVFKQMMTEGQINAYLGDLLADLNAPPLVLSWGIAAVIRVCVGSATVAGLTTVGILAPLLQSSAVSPELTVLAIGSGSLMFSHVNDGGFWLFKEYFNVTIKETILTWSLMETIVSVVGLLGVLLLNMFI